MALESWGLLALVIVEHEVQRKVSPEQGESSTQRLCQGNDYLFLFLLAEEFLDMC